MSTQVPGQCRSGDCEEQAVFYVCVLTAPASRPNLIRVGWDGEFCYKHLLRCIEIKIGELGSRDKLILERMKWAS